MTARDGNCKRAINCMMGRYDTGALWLPIMQKAEKLSADIRLADPRHTCRERGLCGYTDKKNRPDLDPFHCICCGNKSRADINAVHVILKWYVLPDGDQTVD